MEEVSAPVQPTSGESPGRALLQRADDRFRSRFNNRAADSADARLLVQSLSCRKKKQLNHNTGRTVVPSQSASTPWSKSASVLLAGLLFAGPASPASSSGPAEADPLDRALLVGGGRRLSRSHRRILRYLAPVIPHQFRETTCPSRGTLHPRRFLLLVTMRLTTGPLTNSTMDRWTCLFSAA